MSEKKGEEINSFEKESEEFLKKPDLLETIVQECQKEIVGEAKNIILTFLTFVSSKTNEPINLKFCGETSSGKSYLVCKVAKLFPDADIIIAGKMSKTSIIHDHSKKDGERV